MDGRTLKRENAMLEISAYDNTRIDIEIGGHMDIPIGKLSVEYDGSGLEEVYQNDFPVRK